MSILAEGDLIEAKFFNFAANQLGLNVRHYVVNTITGGDLTTDGLAAGMATVFGPLYKPCMPAEAEFVGVSVQRLLPLASSAATSNLTAGVGTATGDLMSRQTSGIITLRTDFPGRKFRGRAYIPFPSEVRNNAAGHPDATYQALIAQIGLQFAEHTGSVPASPDITYQLLGMIRSTTPPAPLTQITSITAQAKWATQRRRSDYGTPNLRPF